MPVNVLKCISLEVWKSPPLSLTHCAALHKCAKCDLFALKLNCTVYNFLWKWSISTAAVCKASNITYDYTYKCIKTVHVVILEIFPGQSCMIKTIIKIWCNVICFQSKNSHTQAYFWSVPWYQVWCQAVMVNSLRNWKLCVTGFITYSCVNVCVCWPGRVKSWVGNSWHILHIIFMYMWYIKMIFNM